jgi:Na+/H+ antiporter NhaA
MDAGFAWIDVFGLAVLAGIGFTVSLLIGELAFGIGSDRDNHVKVAVPAPAGSGHCCASGSARSALPGSAQVTPVE